MRRPYLRVASCSWTRRTANQEGSGDVHHLPPRPAVAAGPGARRPAARGGRDRAVPPGDRVLAAGEAAPAPPGPRPAARPRATGWRRAGRLTRPGPTWL